VNISQLKPRSEKFDNNNNKLNSVINYEHTGASVARKKLVTSIRSISGKNITEPVVNNVIKLKPRTSYVHSSSLEVSCGIHFSSVVAQQPLMG
jgi:hypothetical protein